MNSIFDNALDYTLYCHEELIKAFFSNRKIVSDRAVSLFNHILNSHTIWNERMLSQPMSVSVWQDHDWGHWQAINNANCDTTRQILKHNKLSKLIPYKTTRGESFENTIQDISFHLLNHANYHRGQIAVEFRKCDIAPIVTDYIFFRRQIII